MNRTLLESLHQYFEQKENRTSDEELMFLQLTGRLPYFPITTVSRGDLEGLGFDVSKVSDCDMISLAGGMSSAYTSEVYWIDLDIIAEYLDIPKYMCPKCGSEASRCDIDANYICSSCDNKWILTEPTEQ